MHEDVLRFVPCLKICSHLEMFSCWFQITEEELNAGKSTENATSVANLSILSQTDNENTAIDESDLFGALSESDDEPQVGVGLNSYRGEMKVALSC